MEEDAEKIGVAPGRLRNLDALVRWSVFAAAIAILLALASFLLLLQFVQTGRKMTEGAA
jgi:hypothetical protein